MALLNIAFNVKPPVYKDDPPKPADRVVRRALNLTVAGADAGAVTLGETDPRADFGQHEVGEMEELVVTLQDFDAAGNGSEVTSKSFIPFPDRTGPATPLEGDFDLTPVS